MVWKNKLRFLKSIYLLVNCNFGQVERSFGHEDDHLERIVQHQKGKEMFGTF